MSNKCWYGNCDNHCCWCGKHGHKREACADRIAYVAEREQIERNRPPMSEVFLSDERCSNTEYTRRYFAGTLLKK